MEFIGCGGQELWHTAHWPCFHSLHLQKHDVTKKTHEWCYVWQRMKLSQPAYIYRYNHLICENPIWTAWLTVWKKKALVSDQFCDKYLTGLMPLFFKFP